MSREVLLGALTALSLCIPCAARGQSIEELEVLVTQARLALSEIEAAEDSALAQLDSIRIGTLKLLVHPEGRPRADRAAEVAWASLERQLESSTDLLDPLTIYVSSYGRSRVFSGSGATVRTPRTAPEASLPPATEYVQMLLVGPRHTDDNVAGSIERAVFDYLYNNAMPVDARAWLAGPTSFDSVSDGDWTSAYIELAMASSGIADRCFRGEHTACKKALWLDVSDTPNVDWYSVEEAQMFARANRTLASSECRTGLSPEACRNWLAAISPAPPLNAFQRQQLFRLGLSLGNDGALSRFLAPAENVEARLEAAAGTDIDDLIAKWTERVLSAPVAQTSLTGGSASLAVFWILTLVAIASRSGRWR